MTETSRTAALERRLDVAVPIADIDGEVQRRLANLAKTVKVPGFRPGHVPIKMVAQQYGPQVRTQNLRIAGYPRIEPHPSPSRPGEALEFSAVFEVYPEITMGDLSAVTIE